MQNMFSRFLKATLYMLLCSMLWACRQPNTTILPPDVQLQAGDIVFRQGESIESEAVLAADRSGCYSHIGIVVDSCGQPMIVHAVPGEPDYEGDPDRVKMDRPEVFFYRSRALIGEVMRCNDTGKAEFAAQTALHLYKKGVLFDHDYNDNDSTEMYCTELVDFAYRSAGLHLATGPRKKFSFPFDFYGYLPSAIHASPLLVSVRCF